MSWQCNNCFTENASDADYCSCSHPKPLPDETCSKQAAQDNAYSSMQTQGGNDSGPQITMTPEEHLRQLISEMLENRRIDHQELQRQRKQLRITETRYKEILAEMTTGRNFGQATDIKLKICTKGELRGGKTSNLCFHISNHSPVEYERVSMAIFSNAYAKEPINAELPRKLSGAYRCKWFVPYQAPADWLDDAIFKIELCFYESEHSPTVYYADTEITLRIGDGNSQQSNIHIQVKDKAVLAGDFAINQQQQAASSIKVDVKDKGVLVGDFAINQQTASSIENDSNADFVELPLFFDNEETENRKREFSQVTVEESDIADKPFDSCYLEITENNVTRYVYLITKPIITMGRSSKCDIQVYYLDKNGETDKYICSLVSRDHCRVVYQGNRILLADSGSSQNHRDTRIANMSTRVRLKPEESHELVDEDIVKIGALELKARLFPNLNHNTRFSKPPIAAENLYTKPQILWSEYGGYDKPGAYAALRLRYRNNPYHDEQYILVYKYARFGAAGKIPIELKGQLPPVIGHFRFESGRLFIENLSRNYEGLYLDGRCLSYQIPQLIKPGSEIVAGDVRMVVNVEN